MAKKKNENTLQYLQMPLPNGRRYSKMTKIDFGGLNKRYTIDSGELSMVNNMSTNEYPYLTPSKRRVEVSTYYEHPISMFGFDTFLIVIYRKNGSVSNHYDIKIDYITKTGRSYTSTLQKDTKDKDDVPRSVVQFNVFEEGETGAIIDGNFRRRLLIFPDKKSMFFELDDLTNDTNNEGDDEFTIYDMDNDENDIITPPIKYATVHLSRVFGVDDDRVYASGFNNYTNWALDNADYDEGYNENNAWMSQTQSNTKADGKFTGITNFQGHIVCFKRDYMHEIYNTKNPFRIVDVYAEGAIDNRSIQDVDGKLIFVSNDDVKIYTGSNPRVIGYNLNMSQYTYAVSGTDNRNYYLYCEDGENKHLYVYDTLAEVWMEQSIDSKVINFAHNNNGMYILCADGHIYRMDTEDYNHEWSFETDLITSRTVDIKHIKKLQMLVELEEGAEVRVYVLYDDEKFDAMESEEKEQRLVYTSKKYGRFPIRLKPRKTANYGFKLHIEGEGYAKLYELEIFVESGGDLYV